MNFIKLFDFIPYHEFLIIRIKLFSIVFLSHAEVMQADLQADVSNPKPIEVLC